METEEVNNAEVTNGKINNAEVNNTQIENRRMLHAAIILQIVEAAKENPNARPAGRGSSTKKNVK